MFRSAAMGLATLLALAVSSAQAQVKLEYKYIAGTKAKVQSSTKTHQILSINGTDVETDAEETTVTSTAFNPRRDDGNLPVDVTNDSIRAFVKAQGNVIIDFDSSSPPKEKDDSPLAFVNDVLKAVSGISFTILLDKDNKPVALEGVQKLLDKAQTLDEKAQKTLKDRLNLDRIKRDFDEEHANMPPILVRPGDTWDRTDVVDVGGGQTLTFQKRYEYKGTVEQDGKTLDQIAVRATGVTYQLDPNANPEMNLKVEDSDLHIDSSEGTILFDRETGRVVESKSVNRIKGKLTLVIADNKLPSELDLTLDSNTKQLKQ